MSRGHGHGRGPGSLGSSRSSLTGVGFMPVIAENEISQSPPSPPHNVLTHGSPLSLRVPQKYSRRRSQGSTTQQGLPPPYVPPYILEPPTLHHPPPCYKEADGQSDEEASQSPSGLSGKFRKRFTDRCCCILGIVVIVLVLIAVALAIGLTVGLKNDNDGDTSSKDESTDSSFPAGSFAFEVNLQETATKCTSNPSTWRCYPYDQGAEATFYWIINAEDDSSFTISSTNNPFAPSFTNRPLKVVDEGKSTERLKFSFTMTKTVVPSDSLKSSNRAAECSFAGTVFEATLWTHRSGNDTINPAPGDVKFGAWPCDAEIVQKKESQLGQPTCEDSDGNVIADVQAASGTCQCRYSNFDE